MHDEFLVPVMVVAVTPPVINQAPASAAERLIDEGRMIQHAKLGCCPHLVEQVKGMSQQKVVLATAAAKAARDNPALMFRAMMDGWSAFKIRFELNKMAGRSGKGE